MKLRTPALYLCHELELKRARAEINRLQNKLEKTDAMRDAFYGRRPGGSHNLCGLAAACFQISLNQRPLPMSSMSAPFHA